MIPISELPTKNNEIEWIKIVRYDYSIYLGTVEIQIKEKRRNQE